MEEEEKEEKGEELGAVVKTLAETVKTMNESFTGSITKLSEKIDGISAKDTKEEEEEEFDGDLEVLNRKEFMGVVVDEVGKLLKKHTKPLESEVENVKETDRMRAIQKRIDDCRAKNKDFDDWKPEMAKLAKKMQAGGEGLPGPDRLYKLAKLENPEKVKELEKKAKEKKEGDKEKPKKGKVDMGGLLPSSGKVARSGKMKTKDAAEAAWDEVFGE